MASPIFYFTRFLPGYRIRVLERLNERLDGRLVVCSGQPPGASSLKYLVEEHEHTFRQVRLRNRWIGGDAIHAQSFREPFRRYGNPSAILAEESPRSVTLPLLLRYARRQGAGRVLWGHFSSLNRAFDPKHHLQDRYRLTLARRVEACACYTDGVADLLRPYLPAEKLFVARNTIDLETLFGYYDALAEEGKAAVRRRLGLPLDAPVLAFIGRLVPEKGTCLLLETFSHLRAEKPATLVIVGDGPDRSNMEAYVVREALKEVRFLGARSMTDKEAAAYLFAADVMLMPGYLGLVINHAFAFGLPVVSRQKPEGVQFHSPEVVYVQSGENGLLTPGETAEDLAHAVGTVLSDQARFSANARTYAQTYLTLESMIDGLVSAIEYAEAHRPL